MCWSIVCLSSCIPGTFQQSALPIKENCKIALLHHSSFALEMALSNNRIIAKKCQCFIIHLFDLIYRGTYLKQHLLFLSSS